ncbi:hypothetical protein ACMATS_33920 [Streptoverticillium reticulum]|uniref:hypothetical protein n=1 Tax=Streptoverticillium reticulum TaxID=1433415 RepID=UPI0039BF6DC8
MPREPAEPGTGAPSARDQLSYAQIAPRTRAVTRSRPLAAGAPYDALRQVGTIAPGGVVYEGTITGILRIAPR